MTLNTKTPTDSRVEMTEMVLPQHTNALGTVFGGVVLSWIDIAASICAQRHSERSVVTASFDAMHFLAPIKLGWIANIKAMINYTSKTSCEVGVRICGENPMSREIHHTASAYVTMVSLDSNGRPIAMPGINPETEEEKQRFQEAIARREARLAMKKNIRRR
ncbi:MAG: acyl-CoA thioesterase [Bdellovibrionota bacterium]